MSSILNNQKVIQEERISNMSKSIIKYRRKNQYSIEFKFGSEIDVSKLKLRVEVIQQIPPSIPKNIVFRLESNIQFPLFIDTEESLGELAIDPHSYNYKIVRYDKLNDKHIFHCEPIDRQFTPYELIRDTLFKYNNIIADSFDQFHSKNLLIENYNIVSQEVIEEYEKSLQTPFALFIQRVKNGRITTLAKVINDKYLQLMGVNEEMLCDYIVSTGKMPWFFANTNTNWNEIVTEVFFGNALKKQYITLFGSNFNGQQYFSNVIPKSFHIFDPQDNSYVQYLFYSQVDGQKNLTSHAQIKANCLEYFNKKQQTIINIVEPDEIEEPKRCKFRTLLLDKTYQGRINQNIVLLQGDPNDSTSLQDK